MQQNENDKNPIEVDKNDETEPEVDIDNIPDSAEIADFDEEDRRAPNGGLIYANDEEVKEQRKLGWDFLKSLPYNLLHGHAISSVSLPAKFFEPRSYLERMTEFWSSAPLLTKASELSNPVDRMQYVVAFMIAGLHKEVVPQQKPFNPILGETWQGTFPDGTVIYCEQSSHHPPVSNFELIAPSNAWHLYGKQDLAASMRGNSIKVTHAGRHYVEFKDGQLITYEMPQLLLRGILFGQRVAEVLGAVKFLDAQNRLGCKLEFNPNTKGVMGRFVGWLSGNKLPPVDAVRAEIFTYPENCSDPWDDSTTKTPVTIGEGTWLSFLEFNGKRVWDIKEQIKYKAIATDSPLPSDSRYRDDLQALQQEDYDGAQRWKVALEERQREEARLRKGGIQGLAHKREEESVQ
mmetsp:Transcript_6523/g.10130  ORF Transcript_6523/g.10130 Transcript_6523/m.10130 type:complete len:404 (+) Transcript_6523:107-1318(+)